MSHALRKLAGQADLGSVKSAFVFIGLEQGLISFIYRPRPPFGQAIKPTYLLRKTNEVLGANRGKVSRHPIRAGSSQGTSRHLLVAALRSRLRFHNAERSAWVVAIYR
jgi:hypothetical protein